MKRENERNRRELVGEVRMTAANCEASEKKPRLLSFLAPTFEASNSLERYRVEMYKLNKVGRTNFARLVGIIRRKTKTLRRKRVENKEDAYEIMAEDKDDPLRSPHVA